MGILMMPLWSFAQKTEIKGCVIEELDNIPTPVGYVNISLMRNDSTFVKGTAGNENGDFNIREVENGNYLLSISFVGYEKKFIELKNLSSSIDLGNIRIIPSSVSLDEVTVSASHYTNQIDRKIIFPDEKQIRKSTDGMDLLHNLQLSGIEINKINNTVKGIRGGKAEIRINGVQVNEKEILAIAPKDIIRIEYHDEPSLRYGDSEIVIDYIVRRRETGGSVMAYGQKGMPGDRTDAFSIAKLNYKKSEFSVAAGVNHTNFDGNYRTNREILNFRNGQTITRIEEGIPERKKNDVSSYQVGYSFLEPDKSHFFMKIGYNQYNTVDKSRSLLYTEGDKEHGVLMGDYNRRDNKQPYVNLYYQHNLKNRQMLVFDVVGTLYNADIRRNYEETRQESLLTDIITYTKGNRYSVISEGFYEKIFDAGRFNTGVKHTQIYQEDNYSGNFVSTTNMAQAMTYFYAEWMGRIKNFSYAAGIGGTRVYISQDDTKSDQLRFTPTVRLAYRFNDQLNIRYNGQTGVKAPSLTEMNTLDQAIDSLHIRRGNPLLKSAPYFQHILTISYDKKSFSANLQVVDNYSNRPIMESIFEENGKFIHMMENQRGLHQITTTGFMKVSLLDGNLNMNIRGGLNRVKSRGDRYTHMMNNWFINGGIDYTWKKWNPFWNIGTRRNNLSGETVSFSNQSTHFGLRYKLKVISMSAYYIHSIGWDSGKKNLNQYTSGHIRNFSPDSGNIFMIDFILRYQFGKKYNSRQKKLDNTDNETGNVNMIR